MESRRARLYRRPNPTGVQQVRPAGVTVLTHQPFDGHSRSCESRFFNDETTLGELTPHIEAHRRGLPDNLVIIIVEVTRPETPGHGTGNLDLPPDLRDQLTQLTDKRFPRHIIDSVVNEHVRQPYVPGEGGSVRGNAAWVLKYRGGTGVFHGNPEPDSDKSTHLLTETTWVGAWVGHRVVVPAKTPLDEKIQPPMAVIFISRHPIHGSSDPNFYGAKMATQYTTKGTDYRWRCVREQPLFLFMDLDRLFNNFKVNIARSSLRIKKYMEPSPYDRRYGVVPRVGRLRNALLTLAEFRQEFKTHELARKSMEKIVQHHVDESNNSGARSQTQSDRLYDRLYDLGNELETVNLEVEMLREQCIYLMDSEFNTVAARTDARLGILTLLAFILTPAGFVVTLFSVIESGTMQLIVSTVLVSFFSIVIYFVVDRLYRLAERKRLPNDLASSQKGHADGDDKHQRYP